jgi:lipopolysaccharide transport system ATP-binding protein
MSDIVIQAENIGKLYKLGEIGTGTISHDLNRWWARFRGLEDPLSKIGQTNDRTQKGESEYVWALKGIDFEVRKGEVLGIIGRNGAGKSTLLKILSKVTTPTTGQIKIKGRIASLLEVGTGFHPELTGRENIYLNGAILGMTKTEIRKKFDEIVDFAGVERYIDTPVKRYSSGMYVRLAFAVAAFLEPEILIVDEVLAVGDSEFQKKCLGRMKDVSKQDGRTILFVSHDLSAISTLTNNSIYLDKGVVALHAETGKVINAYTNSQNGLASYSFLGHSNQPSIAKVEIITSEGGTLQANGKKMCIRFEVFMPNENISNIALSFQIFNSNNQAVVYDWIFDIEHEICRKKGINILQYNFNSIRLYKGQYYVKAHLAETKTKFKFQEIDCCSFEIEMIKLNEPEWGWQKNVCQYLEEGNWELEIH